MFETKCSTKCEDPRCGHPQPSPCVYIIGSKLPHDISEDERRTEVANFIKENKADVIIVLSESASNNKDQTFQLRYCIGVADSINGLVDLDKLTACVKNTLSNPTSTAKTLADVLLPYIVRAWKALHNPQ